MNAHKEHELLYATIKDYELREALRRHDPEFDAFEHLSKIIGNKNPSTLRKMCLDRQNINSAKLGFDEALRIMAETGDYRLMRYAVETLRASEKKQDGQIDLFSAPITKVSDVFEETKR